ncbi:dCTP deaminase domain-containing protein [Methylobacterium aquaticum]|uniref:Deoxycytidine deaminase n=1 Tax=Methylobacterium aquaticum TaxID=270351 RepID=A0A0C6EYW8_9HYPH|nr:hypothetical protein [Methylobacterium aquaticum]BAQ45456.1 deoxycytidine deaminase [Methylobacterium aquaticum]
MAFWSGETLSANTGVVSNFDQSQVDCNSYTIRMGDEYYITADNGKSSTVKKILKPSETFEIPAGQFGYLLSKEEISIPPQVMGFLSIRTGFKFQGLINVSGFNVDPGYKGKLLFSVYNAGALPVGISESEPIFKIWFASLDNQFSSYVFKKKGIYNIDNALVRGMSAEILSLRSLSEKIEEIENDVKTRFTEQKPIIDYLSLVFRTITIGVLGVLIAGLLTVSLPSLWSGGWKLAEILKLYNPPQPQPQKATP